MFVCRTRAQEWSGLFTCPSKILCEQIPRCFILLHCMACNKSLLVNMQWSHHVLLKDSWNAPLVSYASMGEDADKLLSLLSSLSFSLSFQRPRPVLDITSLAQQSRCAYKLLGFWHMFTMLLSSFPAKRQQNKLLRLYKPLIKKVKSVI